MGFCFTRHAVDKFQISRSLMQKDGNFILDDVHTLRELSFKVNRTLSTPNPAIKTSEMHGMSLIDQIFRHIFTLYLTEKNPKAFQQLELILQDEFGTGLVNELLNRYLAEYPPAIVYDQKNTIAEYLSDHDQGFSNREIVLQNLVLLWVSHLNPAFTPMGELIWAPEVVKSSLFDPLLKRAEEVFSKMPGIGPDDQPLVAMLRAPALFSPHSITGQLEFIRSRWGFLLGDLLQKLLTSLDLAREEVKLGFIGPGPSEVLTFDGDEFLQHSGQAFDIQAFSKDRDWMPRLVLIAKNIFVWLDQLTKQYGISITRLDQIPEQELQLLSARGITGLWLIGLWQRSPASARIKQLCGNSEAVASAYSLFTYRINDQLGGEEACNRLVETAARYGIRLASDMVPNHMGIDSEWVIQHPDWFLSVDECPFPSYTFNGPDLSSDENVAIQIEDHYYDRSDAAVVFRHIDKRTGKTRYIYHGNDGTSMPWNDTAQLNYLDPKVREAVIQTILQVARRFPIIRFDAAMTLAKKHIQRLWYPEPGSGGAIPSRSEHAISKIDFDRAIPNEFWRDVVERVDQEQPDTLLLAEAFWLMEGYFVRTLGMHRVYNSAFMHMLRDENNAGYRKLMKNTLAFEPEILKRFVNFMNNPDERTAVDQFGRSDKYFGTCTLMATLPGLPMFGHGQMEGFTEKYGMEYNRAFFDETPDQDLIQRHQQEISPLLSRREWFSGVDHFALYDFLVENNQVNENVYVYTNQHQDMKTLVIYNNSIEQTQGTIKWSFPQSGKNQEIDRFLGISQSSSDFLLFTDLCSNLIYLRPANQLLQDGFEITLKGYEHHVFSNFQVVRSDAERNFDALFAAKGNSGFSDLDLEIQLLKVQPILQPLRDFLGTELVNQILDHSSISTQNWESIQPKLEIFLKASTKITQTNKNIEELQKQIIRSFRALVNYPLLEKSFTATGLHSIRKILGNSADLESQSPIRRLVTLAIILFGKLAYSTDQIETDFYWIEEWKLDQPFIDKLRSMRISEQEIKNQSQLLRVMIPLQNWYKKNGQQKVVDLLRSWLSNPLVQTYLKINRFENILWYDHQAFQDFLWWLEFLPILNQSAEEDANLTSIGETVLGVHQLIAQIRKLDEKSECQVEKLLSNK